MNTFAHPISVPRSHGEAAERSSLPGSLAVIVAAVLAVALITGALVHRSMNAQIDAAQAAQVVAQEQAVQSSATLACVQNHGSGAAAKCRAAASTFAGSDQGTSQAAFDRAVHYIYPSGGAARN
jgi:predicted lysophospholipase L1 biosynthesis ABC-type transport system permease subunit